MATYDLRQKSNASTGQKVVPSNNEIRLQNLEDKVTSQSEKLTRIVELLNELSEKKSTS
tara:strand:+ start:297 stop:473 length:177 start_codon:yes stop_codon:yes gene_type:complete